VIGRARGAALVGLAVAVLAALFASPASADQTARLVYARAASCPDEDALRRAVAARLGYDPFRPVAALTIIASVTESAGVYRGDLRLLGEKGDVVGSRSLGQGSDRCADVVAALALSISVAIDPLLLARPVADVASAPAASPPPSPSPPSSTPVPSRPSAPASPPPSPPPTPPRITPFVAFLLVGSAASAPAPALGVAGAGGLRYGRLSIGLEARADLPSAPVSENGSSVSSFLLLASVVPCYHLPLARLAITPFGCAVASAGVVTASSTGVSSPSTDRAAYGAIGPRLGVAIHMSTRFDVVTSLDLAFPLVRHPFDVDGGVAYTPPPVSMALAVGGAYHF
jgi:hypothetical protein